MHIFFFIGELRGSLGLRWAHLSVCLSVCLSVTVIVCGLRAVRYWVREICCHICQYCSERPDPPYVSLCLPISPPYSLKYYVYLAGEMEMLETYFRIHRDEETRTLIWLPAYGRTATEWWKPRSREILGRSGGEKWLVCYSTLENLTVNSNSQSNGRRLKKTSFQQQL